MFENLLKRLNTTPLSPAEVSQQATQNILGRSVPLDCFNEEGLLIPQKYADHITAEFRGGTENEKS